jgi:two-component system, cell cycle sensor histidine kinase and response regulator CckA
LQEANNILGSVIGFAEMIEDEALPDSPVHRRVGKSLKAGFRGRDLVKQILTLSRRARHEMHPLALGTVVDEVIRLVQPLLPPTVAVQRCIMVGEGAVLADSVQLHQVVTNLYTNAVHAMRENGGILEIGLDDETPPSGPSTREPFIEPGRYAETIRQVLDG